MPTSDVAVFIDQQPVALQNILKALRNLIRQIGPQVEESIKYNLPFYSYQGRLCYLNPRQGAVDLGFCQGARLQNAPSLLVGEGKEVRHVRIKALEDIDFVAIETLLHEAMLLNEAESKRKRTQR
ncbi:MAG: DUF1801 domain-containing protein [Roseivirga sp.]